MRIFVTAALLLAGLINLAPVIGVISADQLEGMYGISIDNSDLVILMRHRAILFGLLGAFIIYSASRESLQSLACIAGLVSMISFIVLAYASGDYGEALDKVIIADYIGSTALIAVMFLRRWSNGVSTTKSEARNS